VVDFATTGDNGSEECGPFGYQIVNRRVRGAAICLSERADRRIPTDAAWIADREAAEAGARKCAALSLVIDFAHATCRRFPPYADGDLSVL
jgi:hypothetical protein